MAFMNQERKTALAPAIKAILKKYGMKGSLSVHNHLSLVLTLTEGDIDFGVTNHQVNTYWVQDHWQGKAKDFLVEVIAAMNVGNWDNSDAMTDYFDVGWYVNVNIGKWNKPYVSRETQKVAA